MLSLSIIIIGDEILLGRVTDTNSGLLARTFEPMGFAVKTVRTVGDNAADIRAAITAAMAESDLTITTGGLGPTRDDITKAVMTDIFGGKLIHDSSVAENIDSIFAERGIKINELTRGQAMVPSSCRVIQNLLGTAPIMWFEKEGRVLIAMPGVPYETRGMLSRGVCEAVEQHFHSRRSTMHREFTATNISESALAERLASFEDALPGSYKLAYLPSPGVIVLRLDASADFDVFETKSTELIALIGENFSGCGTLSPAEILLETLRSRGLTLATAESCTGGNIARCITAIAGCSDVFAGSVVSYSNEVKTNVLGVPAADIDAHGAVSRPVVEAMVAGVRRATGADCAVATSGIAGPGGGTPSKPVGTVWIAAATPGQTVATEYHFSGDRQAVIDRATAQALRLLASLL